MRPWTRGVSENDMKLRLTLLDDCESHSLTSRTVRNTECCLVIQFELAFTVRGLHYG